ncbi:MAG: TonB-dependent receptor [Planctomycetales bacterium]|nr:TonB-dependent receptor [Planctomycetales bacterium]NIM10109.1 TonB-dependent receptor [Planctomycetales bacterium]NIN09552.1 TonB-dependent receptor [Planctomycetales bacterium]NIN78663.1 TonB-dependent receptor [Planctomycetales bacterium]NIO35852.1 TonB-dependent receptor [Planctomycetales bacterium]
MKTVIAGLMLVISASVVAGQQVAEGPADEPTLPEIEVRPPQGGPSELSPVELFPQDRRPAFDLPLSYPSLSQQEFGDGFRGDTGIFRSPTSIFDTPAAASIRSLEEIRQRQAPDMFHALQNEVGVLIQSTAAGQASPFLRGLTGQQILILIDGIRLNNSIFRRGPNQYFNTIDPGMVDHIEILRGQGSVLWGSDAIGGVINIVTRSPDWQFADCCGDYFGEEFTEYYNTSNSSSYSRLNVEGWLGRGGVFAGGSFFNPRDLDTGFGDFSRQPGTNYQQWAGDIKFNYLLDELQMLTIALQHFEQEDLPRSDRFPGFPLDRGSLNSASGARFFDPQQRDLAYLRYQALEPLNGQLDALTFTASYHRQREIQTRGIPTTRFQETDVATVGLSLVASKEVGCSGRLTAGVDWYHDDVDSPFGGPTAPIIPDDAWYRRWGMFLNWDVALTDRLDAVAGVRYESIETAGTPVIDVAGVPTAFPIHPAYDDWIGQVGLVYEINPCLHLVGSISEGFRAPNLDDLMANNPNVQQEGVSLPSLDLTPEHSINYEVGIKTNFDRLRTQAFVYWIDLQDNIVSIVPDPAAPTTFASDNQDSIVQGVEFAGEYLLPCGWSIYGNFWYTYGKNLVTTAPLSRIPPMQGILGLRWRDPDLHSYFTLYTWLSDRQDRLDAVRDVTDERIPIGGTPGFATLNARYGRSFGCCDQHRVSVSLENITDQPYQVHGSGVLGTGFTARLGYTWDW